jgi:hypothetical protein
VKGEWRRIKRTGRVHELCCDDSWGRDRDTSAILFDFTFLALALFAVAFSIAWVGTWLSSFSRSYGRQAHGRNGSIDNHDFLRFDSCD